MHSRPSAMFDAGYSMAPRMDAGFVEETAGEQRRPGTPWGMLWWAEAQDTEDTEKGIRLGKGRSEDFPEEVLRTVQSWESGKGNSMCGKTWGCEIPGRIRTGRASGTAEPAGGGVCARAARRGGNLRLRLNDASTLRRLLLSKV